MLRPSGAGAAAKGRAAETRAVSDVPGRAGRGGGKRRSAEGAGRPGSRLQHHINRCAAVRRPEGEPVPQDSYLRLGSPPPVPGRDAGEALREFWRVRSAQGE